MQIVVSKNRLHACLPTLSAQECMVGARPQLKGGVPNMRQWLEVVTAPATFEVRINVHVVNPLRAAVTKRRSSLGRLAFCLAPVSPFCFRIRRAKPRQGWKR
jgi:hypothetical protein